MYYNMINGIAAKPLVDEAQHADGVQQYRFRDDRNNCLQVLWREAGRVDRGIPLAGVEQAALFPFAVRPRAGSVGFLSTGMLSGRTGGV
jgi:hypothetical protein